MTFKVHDLAKQIYGGTLDLLCPRMELQLAVDNQVVAAGCGVLKTHSNGQLFYRMSFDRQNDLSPVLTQSARPGELASDAEYVKLRAIDEVGDAWVSGPILVKLTHLYEFVHSVITRPLTSITRYRRTSRPSGSSVRLCIPNTPHLLFDYATTSSVNMSGRDFGPSFSMDHHKRQIGEANVLFRETEKSWLEVFADQPQRFPPAWAERMCQALEFVTASVLRPAVVVIDEDGEERCTVYSGPFRRPSSFLQPPVNAHGEGGIRAAWDLVDRFFVFAMNDQPKQLRALEELAALRHAAAFSIPSQFLVLSVTIEAVVKLLLPPVTALWQPEALSDLIEHVSRWGGDPGTRDRAIGMLRDKSHSRPIDALYSWANENGVPDHLIKAWKVLRNRVAHGGGVEYEQADWDSFFSCTELLYRIVAWAVGFKGPIQGLSERGWEGARAGG